MKILITGQTGLASALSDVYKDHNVYCVSRSTGHDINLIKTWGDLFLDCDVVFNCAYSDFAQLKVLEFFFEHWKDLTNKKIITIGSRAINQPPSDPSLGYWPYRVHKQALQLAHDTMISKAKCDMKIINPGPIDTPMIAHLDVIKFNPATLAEKIKTLSEDQNIKRVDLWV